MGEFVGLVAVVLIFGLPILAIWTHHQRKMMQMKERSEAGEAQLLRARLDRVEQRLGVLETLATDPAARLADDIERLRDARS